MLKVGRVAPQRCWTVASFVARREFSQDAEGVLRGAGAEPERKEERKHKETKTQKLKKLYAEMALDNNSGRSSLSAPPLGSQLHFEVLYQSKKSRARVGRIITAEGREIMTPTFVPVATCASVKALHPQQVHDCGTHLTFCNTYHLMLHPGSETVAKAGGLHRFMNHKGALITDSGGFQVFSLAYGSVHRELTTNGSLLPETTNATSPGDSVDPDEIGNVIKGRRQFLREGERTSMVTLISEDGVQFVSYRDGRKLKLNAELSIEHQKRLGADIIVPFDELPPFHIEQDQLKESVSRTHRWQLRSLKAHLEDPRHQALYGIVHGGLDHQLRSISSSFVLSHPFDGIALGGSLGKTKDDVASIADYVTGFIRQSETSQALKTRPIHLLGIGDLQSIDRGVPLGIDSFDSSYPSRAARHGNLFLKNRRVLNLQKTTHKESFEPIDPECQCYTCRNHTLAYLHHLLKARESTFGVLATIHNLSVYAEIMAQHRQRILDGEI